MRLADARQLRILDFDIENRPLSYWMPDRPTADITAIASMWSGKPATMQVLLLIPKTGNSTLDYLLWKTYAEAIPEGSMVGTTGMLELFSDRYLMADMVTGHYIRKHDLPIINGALYDADLPLLGPKLTQDTKLDMFKKADVPATQEHLLEVLGAGSKEHMTQGDWRMANRLSIEGVRRTYERVSSDVLAHDKMRQEMVARGWLKAPSMWAPGGGYVSEGPGRTETGDAK
jgi:hypothetical protein